MFNTKKAILLPYGNKLFFTAKKQRRKIVTLLASALFLKKKG